MFEQIKKSSILQIFLIILVLIIIIGIFSPRSNNDFLSAGLNVNARLGRLRGGINVETFENRPTLALFYAPWCGHCKSFKPEFEKLKNSYKGPVKIVGINCDEDKKSAEKHGIQGFPTLRLYKNGLNNVNDFQEYNGQRTAGALNNFLNSNA